MLWRRPGNKVITGSVVAIGNFDGIHLGHQKIIETTKNLADQHHYIPVLLTFDPYPKQFFYPDKAVARLTTLREKAQLVSLDLIYALPFDQIFSEYSPEEFIQKILIQKLKAKYIIVGEDFHFGYQRKGDTKLLQSITAFDTQIISPVMIEGVRVSSTRVREALREGNLKLTTKLLGRYYSMMGRVVKGHQRGRQLGFPTANIALHKRIPPLRGVFAVTAKIENKIFSGVANIGSRPTVDGTWEFLEVYIFDFDQDIYGKYITIEFIQKIRDEIKFNSLEVLKQQIAEDVIAAKQILTTL